MRVFINLEKQKLMWKLSMTYIVNRINGLPQTFMYKNIIEKE